MRWQKCVIAAWVGVFLLASTLRAATPTELWDNSRYMSVAEVRPGMTGYGLTVFDGGDKIQKFDVQVVDVLRNFASPKRDVVLINCKGAYLEHTGDIEGMSGSPIYLYDLSDTMHAHPRMIGAFAYGWEWAKDPLAGVQPIEYMLKIPTDLAAPAQAEVPAAATAMGDLTRPTWSLADVPTLPGFKRNGAGYPARPLVPSRAPMSDSAGMQPLATPLMASGLTPTVRRWLAPMLADSGLSLLDAGGGGGARPADHPVAMEPGAALVVPIVTGDLEFSAIGTITEVRGNRIFGFGHEFNNEGPISLPMGAGTISTVVADQQSSFKLGALDRACGTLTSDQTVGVAGLIGPPAPMAPIDIHIRYADGSLDQTYHFNIAIHPKFTPLLSAALVAAALSGVKDLPENHTVNYDLNLEFADNHLVHIVNTGVNGGLDEAAMQIALPIMAASENPFHDEPLRRIRGTIDVSQGAKMADITNVTLDKLKYAPGETIKAFISYRPWHEGEHSMEVDFDLGKDLPDGQYQLVVSDWSQFFDDQRQAEPFRFTAQSTDELFAVVRDFEDIRHNALYFRLVRDASGVAVGRSALAGLPQTVRQVLMNSGRSDLTAYITSSVKVVPTDMVMNGSTDFSLTISHTGHVEPGKPGRAPTTLPAS
jgi:hypothetical protein